ncbi:MAG TPA: VOC family protein [Acidimicrobiales bacterium]
MIESLAYIGFRSPNADVWKTFGPEILGLELADPGPDGSVRLRVDDAVVRITVHPGEIDDLAYLGWAVAGPAELAAAVDRLGQHGVEVTAGSPELAAERAVAALAWFVDPFGFRHELSFGQVTRPSTFRAGRAITGFVTGEGGLGHAVLIVPDLAAAEHFYLDVMGFRLSDQIEIGMSIRFLHCNPRHHSLAFSAVPGMVGFHHLMVEVGDLDDVGTAWDMVQARDDIPVAMTLGRHTNDLMTSFYLRTPSGFEIEYGWGGALVDLDEPWIVRSYDAMSIWGHKPPAEVLFPGILRHEI